MCSDFDLERSPQGQPKGHHLEAHIRFPTVPKNKARIRLSVTSWLTRKQIEDALDVFESAGKKFKIL